MIARLLVSPSSGSGPAGPLDPRGGRRRLRSLGAPPPAAQRRPADPAPTPAARAAAPSLARLLGTPAAAPAADYLSGDQVVARHPARRLPALAPALACFPL